jgi:uncharacterized caspase-like protein
MNAPQGVFIAYATGPGLVAEDGKGRNGTYTKHLLNKLQIKGITIEQVFKKVMVEVQNETNAQQVPWVSFSIGKDFYFNPPDSD